MLFRKEKAVMRLIFSKCENKEKTCLMSPLEISNGVFPKYEIDEVEIEEIIESLKLDNYITVVDSERKGKKVYCITLKSKGESFEREISNNRKSLLYKLATTVILAVVSFVIGLLLKALF